MYDQTRIVQDENRRALMEAKGQPGNNVKVAGSTQILSNRRALGDIGNLVGALSARCTVSKDGSVQTNHQDNSAVAALHNNNVAYNADQQNRQMTRKFGATLSNSQHPHENYRPSKIPSCTNVGEDCVQNEIQYDDLAWRTKQRRTMGHHHINSHFTAAAAAPPAQHSASSSATTSAPPPDDSLGTSRSSLLPPSKIVPAAAHHQSTALFALKQKKKKQTLTEILTSRSYEATTNCGGSEVEMEEAEEPLPNIDETDAGNPLAAVEYVEDIYDFYRKTEVQSCVPADYMSRQADINEKMRAILIDWLIEVHYKFKLMPETLFLTVNLIDRFLASQPVVRKNLQLVGVTAMLLASKYEEIWAPEVQDFVYISDKAYTREQVLDMEKQMLNKLKFNLTVPTPYVFLVRFLKAAISDAQMEMLSFFFIELCLTEYSMMGYCPSHLAAAAVYTAHHTLKRTPYWSTTLQRHSGYTEMHLRDCAMKMASFHRNASKGNLTVVHKKYASPNFNSVANLEPVTLLM